MIKIILLFLVLIFCNCYSYLWVSDLNYVTPVYGIKKSQIVDIDTIKNSTGDLYKVKYRLINGK